MNKSTKLYCEIQTLLDNAHKALEPISNLQNNDYDEMLRRLINVMTQNIQLISQMKDVSKIDDDFAANYIFNCNQNAIDFGTAKLLSSSLMYVMGKMCKELSSSINKNNARRYTDLAFELVIDMTDLYNQYCYTHWDKCDRSNFSQFPIKAGRRASLNLTDQREVIRSMFWMENIPSIDDLSFRDIRPHVQILIRQSIEMLLKQIIGYYDIIDINGARKKNFTQIGAKFLSKYRDKQNENIITGDGWKIELNMPIKTLERLNAWCNNFTHDPYIVPLPIIYFAYDQYERFTSKVITKPSYNITGEEKMRAEFETFVIKQDPKVTVTWPEGTSIAPISVKMRKTAIKENLKNIKRAYWKEKLSLLQFSTNYLVRNFSNLIWNKFMK